MDGLADRKRCKDCLVTSIGELQGKIEPTQLDETAELIIQTMSGPWRYFHTPEHIFEVGGSVDAIEVLAALFHDLVYVQVDHGVSLNISRYIAPYVKEVRSELIIREATRLPDSLMFEIVAAVFGFVPGQPLSPFAGQNEFLSALIAAECLEHSVRPDLIAEIAACIEATIPFRPHSSSGLSPADLLYERLLITNQRFNFGWNEQKTAEVVKRAVRLANRDVENFATPNSAHFLDNTWNLLPETNHELINANSYTVKGYRRSLQKMEGFMNFLKPELVFQQYLGEPDDANYNDLVSRTRKNIEVAKLYLGSKLFTIAIIEALSYRIGRDIPLSSMMGELPSSELQGAVLAGFLPDIPSYYPPENPLEHEVLELLSKGRTRESPYDLKNSPLTTFIVKSIGFSKVRSLVLKAKEFFQGKLGAEEFLSECNSDTVDTIKDGILLLFESRKAALQGVKIDETYPVTTPAK